METKEIKNDYDFFELFLKLYKEKSIEINWRKNGLGIYMGKDTHIENIQQFRKYASKLLEATKNKVTDGKIDIKYDKYVDQLIECDEDIVADIIARCKSNANICNVFDHEILTKRNKNLDIKGFSALINFSYEKPSNGEALSDQITFEFSIKDLKLLYENIGNIIENINKLNNSR